MKNSLITCSLFAAVLFGACKKDKYNGVDFGGTANEISGEWAMNPVTVTGEPATTVVPKYQFGTNSRYSFVKDRYKSETGKYLLVQRPPIGFYVVVFTPDSGAEYHVELHLQTPNTAMFGARMFHRLK